MQSADSHRPAVVLPQPYGPGCTCEGHVGRDGTGGAVARPAGLERLDGPGVEAKGQRASAPRFEVPGAPFGELVRCHARAASREARAKMRQAIEGCE